jgi:uncharacterized membrane protein
MIKKYLKTMLITSAVILIPMVVGLLLWNRLPEEMVVHWGINSTPNGWGSRGMVVFGIPLFMLALQWVCMLATTADPKIKDQGTKPMKLVLWICPVLCFFCCFVVYAQALGLKLDVDTVALVLMGILFIVIGNYLPKCKQSYTLGIKLPWTLASEANWNATHRFSGRIWVIGGVLFLLCVFLPKGALVWAMAILLPLMIVPTVVYSYLYYKKHGSCK